MFNIEEDIIALKALVADTYSDPPYDKFRLNNRSFKLMKGKMTQPHFCL